MLAITEKSSSRDAFRVYARPDTTSLGMLLRRCTMPPFASFFCGEMQRAASRLRVFGCPLRSTLHVFFRFAAAGMLSERCVPKRRSFPFGARATGTLLKRGKFRVEKTGLAVFRVHRLSDAAPSGSVVPCHPTPPLNAPPQCRPIC